jgi:hypothetical protein
MSKYIIDNPLLEKEINKIINISKLKMYVKKYIDSRMEYYTEYNSNLEIESNFSEFWINKCIESSKRVSFGNNPMDIILENEIGIDCIALCMNKKLSNEKSIIQNFEKIGNTLDDLFNQKRYNEILDDYKINYFEKIRKCINDYKLKRIYYALYLSNKDNIYFTLLPIYIYNINQLSVLDIKNNKSFNINNFINSDNGTVLLYKSKKRIELRFKENILKNCIKIY